MKALTATEFNFPGQTSVYHGKVRDVYNIGGEKLVMVATDRISAFDVVLPKGIPYNIENDWSAASYWLEIAALAKDAEITLPGLFKHSYQGDSKMAENFGLLGAMPICKDNRRLSP